MLTLRKEKMQINQGVWETVKVGLVYTYHPPFLFYQMQGERNDKRTVKAEYSNALETLRVSIF